MCYYMSSLSVKFREIGRFDLGDYLLEAVLKILCS